MHRREHIFYSTLVIEFVFHYRFSVFLVLKIMRNFIDVQRLQLVLKTGIQAKAVT